jgi:4,5-DOPA dioxygenase extradiol
MSAGDLDALVNFEDRAPAAHVAHPRTEHWAPLYVAVGAADASGSIEATTTVEGFWFGLSKRSWQLS